MLLNAGNKNFPQQQRYNYGQEHDQNADNSFSDDDEGENGEEEEDNDSDYEDGELDSAQKQKLKRDLLMMGYQQNGDFEDDDVEALEQVVAHALAANGQQPDPQQLQAMQEQQQMMLQQQQFQDAMRIQMAMKQMPLDDGAMPVESMGLRVKNPTI